MTPSVEACPEGAGRQWVCWQISGGVALLLAVVGLVGLGWMAVAADRVWLGAGLVTSGWTLLYLLPWRARRWWTCG